MDSASSLINWQELERVAPAITRVAKQRFDLLRVALLGTLRSDGSPRISPVEPYLSQGELLFGAMTWSLKTRDLLRDARCVLHSAITATDAGEAEIKLYGRAIGAPDAIRTGCLAGWWQAHPDAAATVFALQIAQATSTEWRLEEGRMLVRRWSSSDGLKETSRSYP